MTRTDPPRWGVVVPVKQLTTAKSRLSTRPAPQRRALALAFALDVVQACLDAHGTGAVVVVSPEGEVREAAAGLGARTLDDARDEGLVPALRLGVELLRAHQPTGSVLLLAADLPALRPVDVDALLAHAEAYDRSFVADVAGTGTTALAARGGHDPDPRFGPRSRAAHRASGAVELEGGDLARVRCDVDTEVDLWHATALGLGARTDAALAASG